MKSFKIEKSFLYFSLRTTAASLLAHWAALRLGFHSPQWAAITVWVVTQPSRGKTLSKGFYRLLGTCIGALFAILLIRYFADNQMLFLLFLSLWVGLCTALANLVLYFRSYGLVLAGFTAALVGLSFFSHPEQVAAIAEGRVLAIFLGIFVSLIVASFLSESSAKKDFYLKLDLVIFETIQWLVQVFERRSKKELVLGERELVSQITVLDEMMTYAAAESMQIRRQKNILQKFMAHLFTTISAGRAVSLFYRKHTFLEKETSPLRDQWIKSLGQLKIENLQSKAAFASDADDRLLIRTQDPHQPEMGKLAERVSFLKKTFDELVSQYGAIQSRTKLNLKNNRPIHRDYRHARLVGFRSFLAVGLVGILWMVTKWSIGPLMVIMTAVNVGIFATNINPQSGILKAFKASLVALLASFICLHLISFFPSSLLWIYFLLSLFLLPGGLLVTHPTYFLSGTLFCANFLVFVSPNLPMPLFELRPFATLASGFLSSLVICYFIFYFVFPTDPVRRSRSMLRDIVRDLERIAKAPTTDRAFEWETLMYNRVGTFIKVMTETGVVKPEVFEGCFAVIDMGQIVVKLRLDLQSDKTPATDRGVIQGALLALGEASKMPAETAAQLESLVVNASQIQQTTASSINEIIEKLKAHSNLIQSSSEIF